MQRTLARHGANARKNRLLVRFSRLRPSNSVCFGKLGLISRCAVARVHPAQRALSGTRERAVTLRWPDNASDFYDPTSNDILSSIGNDAKSGDGDIESGGESDWVLA
jgi:hypothetical protein